MITTYRFVKSTVAPSSSPLTHTHTSDGCILHMLKNLEACMGIYNLCPNPEKQSKYCHSKAREVMKTMAANLHSTTEENEQPTCNGYATVHCNRRPER